MRASRRFHTAAVATCAAALLFPAAAGAALKGFHQRNLVADQPGVAELTDPNLVNAWGLAFGQDPATPAWVSDNGTDVSTLYRGATNANPDPSIVPLVVSIPEGAPTGVVFNDDPDLQVNGSQALFVFSSEAGAITAWNPSLGTSAQLITSVPGAIFKGLAIADTPDGARLYATDFHNGVVDVWDNSFNPVHRPGAFTDPNLPNRFAPFGIQRVGQNIVVTYAKQDADAEDDVAGPGNGVVDIYTMDGTLKRRVATGGVLNSPWGIAKAPQGFGNAGGDLLIGNFGNGRINAFDLNTSPVHRDGALLDDSGNRLEIDGLWALQFGNGTIGSHKTLLFTAGPDDESHGLFGTITH
jgi:uncharacterized protein (TIGR03118 family)